MGDVARRFLVRSNTSFALEITHRIFENYYQFMADMGSLNLRTPTLVVQRTSIFFSECSQISRIRHSSVFLWPHVDSNYLLVEATPRTRVKDEPEKQCDVN